MVTSSAANSFIGGMSVFVVVYATFPRFPDLTAFDPIAMGHFEATMWKNYYQRRYFHLIKGIYQASRHVRFSPATSVWIAFKGGIAASSFQASRSRQEAERAIPALVEYFKAVAPGAASAFSAEAAAHAELDWWQARREAVPPSEYGLTIPHVSPLCCMVSTMPLSDKLEYCVRKR